MAFAGNICSTRQHTHIEQALRTGGMRNKSIEIQFQGLADRFVTFEGLFWTASGSLEFRHCGTRVLTIDFDRDRITDFGYLGYSMTTSAYLNAWVRALDKMSFLGMKSLDWSINHFRWTVSDRYNKEERSRGAGYAADMEKRFREGVPWVQKIAGDPWFCGAKYDANLVDRFDFIRREILQDGVSWHWFTADWDDRGQWVKRFINAAAKKRWEKHEARRLRQAARVTDQTVEAARA